MEYLHKLFDHINGSTEKQRQINSKRRQINKRKANKVKLKITLKHKLLFLFTALIALLYSELILALCNSSTTGLFE